MAFVHHQLGALVSQDPAAARTQLAALFAEHKTREAVSAATGVDARTIARWITRLRDKGHGDPRTKPEPDPDRGKKIAKKPGKKGRARKPRKKVVAR